MIGENIWKANAGRVQLIENVGEVVWPPLMANMAASLFQTRLAGEERKRFLKQVKTPLTRSDEYGLIFRQLAI